MQNLVVDASSLEGNRRYRRSTTDQRDVQKLLPLLVRFVLGERRLWKVVRVPTAEDEALRQPHRALIALTEERTPHSNRMKGLLAGLGLEGGIDHTFPERLPALRQWDGHPVPALRQERRLRECARWSLGQRQSQDLANAEARLVRDDQQRHVAPVRPLMGVRGIGAQSAGLLGREVCGWRASQNRRARAALAGLTPTPYHSGQSQREQGIRKAGSKRLRWLMGDLAWGGAAWATCERPQAVVPGARGPGQGPAAAAGDGGPGPAAPGGLVAARGIWRHPPGGPPGRLVPEGDGALCETPCGGDGVRSMPRLASTSEGGSGGWSRPENM